MIAYLKGERLHLHHQAYTPSPPPCIGWSLVFSCQWWSHVSLEGNPHTPFEDFLGRSKDSLEQLVKLHLHTSCEGFLEQLCTNLHTSCEGQPEQLRTPLDASCEGLFDQLRTPLELLASKYMITSLL